MSENGEACRLSRGNVRESRRESGHLALRPRSVMHGGLDSGGAQSREERLGDQALFAFAVPALASISEQVYDVFAVMLLWGGQPLW